MDKFYIGPMVEHTPTYSKKTLFVVGVQNLDRILELAREYKTPHIFMGLNHSFKIDGNESYWDKTITALLDRGYWVTLDYEAHEHKRVQGILNKGIWQSRLFVPLLNVRIPKIQESSPNLTIKIDDTDFKATNPGVWCIHFHEITDSNRFTDWVEYGNYPIVDEVEDEKQKYQMQDSESAFLGSLKAIAEDDKLTPMPPYMPAPEVKAEKIDLKSLKPMTPLPDSNVKSLRIPDVKNDVNLGLDPEPTSALKGGPEKVLEKLNISPIDAAEAYASGATSDPLGKKAKK